MKADWDDISEGTWLEAADAAHVPLQQTYAYGEVCFSLGRDVLRARLTTGREAGFAQCIARRVFGWRRIALMSRGPFWPEHPECPTDAYPALRKTIPLARLGVFLATPEGQDLPRGVPVMSAATVAELPIFDDADAQRRALHQKWRNRLVRAETLAVSVERMNVTPALIEMMLARDAAQQRKRGYRNLPPDFLRSWARLYPEATHILVARKKGEICAAMLFLRHGTTATYYLGWRNADSGTSIHNLILWKAMRGLACHGVQRLDLGLLDTQKSSGLARFKLGTGAVGRKLSGTYLLR
jgi:hypothetical protein